MSLAIVSILGVLSFHLRETFYGQLEIDQLTEKTFGRSNFRGGKANKIEMNTVF